MSKRKIISWVVVNNSGYVIDADFEGNTDLIHAVHFDSKKSAQEWIEKWPDDAGSNPWVKPVFGKV